jgi:hypothetical protein
VFGCLDLPRSWPPFFAMRHSSVSVAVVIVSVSMEEWMDAAVSPQSCCEIW